MTIEERAERAVQLRSERKCNCCQAAAVVLADQTSLTEQQLWDLCAGFAGGMGNMESVCGSLCGVVMVAGAKIRQRSAVGQARLIQKEFVRTCGGLLCKDLKGRDTDKVLCPCEQCVCNAVLAYGKIMGLE